MKSSEITHAIPHHLGVLAEDARALFAATAEATDEKVVAARRRLEATFANLKLQVADGARAADHAVREHPYQSLGVAFGLGALFGCLLCRRD